jgi:propionate CoA-transferase
VDEGRSRKFVKRVEQITYPVSRGVANHGQSALLITERAVFQVDHDGLTLTEVAKGIDIQRDIIEQMEFGPTNIAEPLKLMSSELFRP